MAVAAALQPVSVQVVCNAFVRQYYHIQHLSPGLIHRFYQDSSKLGRPEDDGTMSITTTMQAINEKILSLNYTEYRAQIKSVDGQESYNGGVHVLVTGYLIGKDNMIRNFTQSFFLAPQDKGYFVLNDMLRYVEDISDCNGNQTFESDVEASLTLEQDNSENDLEAPLMSEEDNSENDVEAPLTPEQDNSENDVDAPLTPERADSPVQEIHVSEQTKVAVVVSPEESLNPFNNGGMSIVEEEVPVAEVVDEVPDDLLMVVESNSKIEEVPKKSYASIVMDMKESAVMLSSPAAAPRRSIVKSQQQQLNLAQVSASAMETPVSDSDAIDNGNIQEGKVDGYSIYIRGLPLNAVPSLLEDEFKRFGPIKSDGIQVRSKQGFCFGFVEFEVASAVEKAIEASPITIGGRQAFVEEKRSTNNSRVNNNRGGWFSAGRGYGFRNDGANYGSGRGYSRNNFNGRTEYGNRGNNRGGFPYRGGDGYQRADNVGSNGSRMNRGSGMFANGTVRTVAPRVSATA